MATALRHVTECSVCMLAFEDPKVLPCDHSFCASCISRLKKGSKLKCPLCNATCSAGKIRTDFRLSQFIDALKQKSEDDYSTDEDAEDNCDLCRKQQIQFHCDECQQWICKDCKKHHMRSTASKDHHVVPLATKAQDIKDKLEEESVDLKSKVDEQSKSIENIEAEIDKLKSDEIEALRISRKIRQKCLKEITEYFDLIESRIRVYIKMKIRKLEREKMKIENQIQVTNARWKQLETKTSDDLVHLVLRENDILQEATKLIKTIEDITIEKEEVNLKLIPGTLWTASTAAELEINGSPCGEIGEEPLSFSYLSSFTEEQFKVQNEVNLTSWPHNLRLIDQELWSCQGKAKIEIFSLDLNRQRTLTKPQWHRVCDVCETYKGNIVVADVQGLFNLTENCKDMRTIDTGSYNSVAFYDDNLYAYAFNPPRICICRYTDRWIKHQMLRLRFQHNAYVTLSVKRNKITACSKNDGRIIVLSLTGEFLHAIAMNRSELQLPYLCFEDEEGSLLITDRRKNHLQVVDKHWNTLMLEPIVKEPRSVVLIGDKIYVTSRLDRCCYKLFVYAPK